MADINRCHQIGCPDLCCIGPIRTLVTPDNLNRFSRTTQKEYGENIDSLPPGVYYVPLSENAIYLQINTEGERCGFNNSRIGCVNPNKYPWCERMRYGGDVCNQYRREVGLPEINPDGTPKVKTNITQSIFTRIFKF